ncbi:DAK2 domain-containing protein [Dactylosporangium darangshiense]|uniref:DAK2 domain-containing protein n=1 Tax=Dactylosporangium darangshiense TaxID=579108 RepID=UPI0031E516F9
MPDSVDAAIVRRWCVTGLGALRRHQAEIDALNVYPVPDGDTGANLVLTMTAAVRALGDRAEAAAGGEGAAGAEDAVGEVLREVARGALMGAHGNSGVILAQLFKGLADGLEGVTAADGRQLARALDEAARGAYRAVAAPVEGTVLSVGAAAAAAALDAASGPHDVALVPDGAAPGPYDVALLPDGAASGPGGVAFGPGGAASGTDGLASEPGGVASGTDGAASRPGGVAEVARAAANGARVALARTPEQLPALARAGVVDAGGRGLVVLLDALVETLTGEAPPELEPGPVVPVGVRPGASMVRETGSDAYGYEVQYLLRASAGAVEDLRRALLGLGDSLVVVGEGPIWHVHVHVNDVGAAIEAGVEAGRPSRITVTRFADQIAARAVASASPEAAPGPEAAPVVAAPVAVAADETRDEVAAPSERAVVVVCSGAGLAELLEGEGAAVVTGSPSTGEILAAICGTGAGRVVVLPNDSNVLGVASAAAAEARALGVRAGVVPTRSPVQALAAMAVRDAARRFEDDVIAMAEAAARCRSAEVTIAGREALTVAGRCQPGDVLAIVDGEVNLIGQDLSRTACGLLDRMLGGGGELVTLIVGEDAPAGLGDALRAHVEGAWPFVEVQCYEGGQPHYPLLVGVE